MRRPLSQPLLPIELEPEIPPVLQAAAIEAIRWGWTQLRIARPWDPMTDDEWRLNHGLAEILNDRQHGRRRATALRLFHLVVRNAAQEGADGSTENAPDLTFIPRAFPHGVRHTSEWAIFAECKIIEPGHRHRTPGEYVEKGVLRFADGRYARRVNCALMVAYVRDDRTPRAALAPYLPALLSDRTPAGDGTDVLLRTLHDRSGLTRPCVSLELTHLWLDARP